MLNAHELRALEIEAELAKLHATHAEARSKIAGLESQRALLTPQVITAPGAPGARSGAGVGTVITIAVLAALVTAGFMAGADRPDHGMQRAGFYVR